MQALDFEGAVARRLFRRRPFATRDLAGLGGPLQQFIEFRVLHFSASTNLASDFNEAGVKAVRTFLA
jgi:hypothetical protein